MNDAKRGKQMAMIPQRTIDTIDGYFKHGMQPGSFVRCVLENDLQGAAATADFENRVALFDIAKYVFNNLPIGCHGSPRIVNEWLASKRSGNSVETVK